MTDQANTTVSDDVIASMIAGLEGVISGPWAYEKGTVGPAYIHAVNFGGTWVCELPLDTQNHMPEGLRQDVERVGKHLARCDPYTMRSIPTELSARRATAEVTEAMVERGAVALFKFDYPKDKWSRFGQKDYHPERYRAKSRAALLAALNPPMGR